MARKHSADGETTSEHGAGSILDIMGRDVEIPERPRRTIQDDAENLRQDAVVAGIDWSEVG